MTNLISPGVSNFFNQNYLLLNRALFNKQRIKREIDFLIDVLELTSGTRILDLGCGPGRHWFELQDKGCNVIGLDNSIYFIEHIRQKCHSLQINPDIVFGDMRFLPLGQKFDVVCIMNNSFGYFKDEENIKILTQARDILRIGGKFLIDVLNPYNFVSQISLHVSKQDVTYGLGDISGLLKTIYLGARKIARKLIESIFFDDGRSWIQGATVFYKRTGLGVKTIENFSYEPRTGIVCWCVTIQNKDGSSEKITYCQRQYTCVEIESMLIENGFSVMKVFGDYDKKSEFSILSKHQIILAKKI
jgi:SAM-dependent methyltransferase